MGSQDHLIGETDGAADKRDSGAPTRFRFELIRCNHCDRDRDRDRCDTRSCIDARVVLHDLLVVPSKTGPHVAPPATAAHSDLSFAEALAGRKRTPERMLIRFAERRLYYTAVELLTAAEELLGARWRKRNRPVFLDEMYAMMAQELARATDGTPAPVLHPTEVHAWLSAGFPGVEGKRRRRAAGVGRALVVAWRQRRAGDDIHIDAKACDVVRDWLELDPQLPIGIVR